MHSCSGTTSCGRGSSDRIGQGRPARASMAQSKERNLRQDVFIGVMVTLGLFVAVEAGARVYHHFFPPRPSIWRYQQFDPRLGFTLRPNFHERGIRINSRGFRGEEFETTKPPGVFRIVALGDSTTFGLGESDDATYSRHLEMLLNAKRAKACPVRYEVINGGVEGYSTRYVLARLRYDVIPIQPDLVFVYVGWNNLFGLNPERPETSVNPVDLFNIALRKSLVLRKATWFLFSNIMPRLEEVTPQRTEIFRRRIEAYRRFSPQQFYEEYGEILDTAHSAGIRVAVGTLTGLLDAKGWESRQRIMHFPHFTTKPELMAILEERYNDAIRRVAAERGVPVVDLQAGVRGAPEGAAGFFFDTMHMYPKGYEFLASVIAAEFERAALLPCPPSRKAGK